MEASQHGIPKLKQLTLMLVLLNFLEVYHAERIQINSDKCKLALGMQSFEIPDSALSSSSSYDPEGVGPTSSRIRLEILGGAWCPAHAINKDSYEYLQIDLGILKVITLVETQGRFGNGQGQEFVDQYYLEYQREDGGKWFRFRNRWGQQLFQGNSNTYISELRIIDPPIIAKKVRFVPFASRQRTVCLRVELYGCTWTDGLVSYSMSQGEQRGSDLDLYDLTYDGDIAGVQLSGGLGQLTDGILGDSNFRLESFRVKGYDWVGWKDETQNGPVVINFKFDAVRNFTNMVVHANNFIDKDVQVFRTAKIYFSIGGKLFPTEPVVYNYMRDTLIKYSRDVEIPLEHRIAKYVRVELYFDSRWILISEVSFTSEIARGNHSVEVLTTTLPTTKSTTTLFQQHPSNNPNILHVDLVSKNNKSSGQFSYDDASTTAGILDSSKEKKETETEYLGIIIGALAAVILLLFVIIMIIIMRHRRNKYSSHRPMKVIDAPPRNVTLDLNDLQNTYSRKLLNGSANYNHFSASDGDSDRELLKGKNFDVPYGSPFDAIQQRRLPDVPKGSESSGSTLLSRHSRDYAVPDVTTSVLMSEGNSPPPPYTAPVVPSAPVYNGSVKYSTSPSGYKSLRQGPHYATSDVTNLPNIQGVSGNNVYAVPNPEMLWQEDNTVTEFPRENLRFIEKLGEGQFGEVHLCEAENITNYLSDDLNVSAKGSRSLLVAVKMLHKNAQQPARRDFHKEVQIMARLKDPNIVRVLGVCTREDPLCVIVEYMKYGDLNQFLQGHVLDLNSTLHKKKTAARNALSFGCLTYMAAQVASGMRYLEGLNMVHRDLATRNCLVGSQYVVKISDFGMSRGLYCSDYYRIEGKAVLPIRWMAWESILLGKFSTKTDVWSFGITLWEILTLCREQPFENLTDEQVIENCGHYYRNDGLEMYLPCPPGCPREFYDLIRESWNRDDMQRPSFREVHMFLQRKNMGYDPRSEHGYTSSPVLV